jgi:prophage maintenance system killer protein
MKKETTIQGNKGEIVLYRMGTGRAEIRVHLEADTLWLTQKQIAELFETERSVITRHVGNIFTSGELVEKSNVQKMHIAGSDKPVAFYNLDVIISVGYRVNSLRGTQFRIWATQIIKEHLVKGYTANERRLKELRQSLKLVGQVLDRYDVTGDQSRALLRVVSDYSYALDLLDDYDHHRLSTARIRRGKARGITYEEAVDSIARLKKKFGSSALFGKEKDGSLAGSLNAVMQTFEGKDVYPGLEEKAAHLLYFLVKNHSFVDGNKRIAAALFLWFMEKNNLLLREGGTKRIADNALVAITLLIAESSPQEKDVICKMVVNLINDRN